VGSEIYPDFASAAAKMTHGGDRFEPIAANQKIYSQLYSQVYRKMYRGLKPSYEAIRKITGYPS
jgi:ribulose kinase